MEVTTTPTPIPSAPITLREATRILRRRLPILLVTFAIVVIASLLMTSQMKPVYEARARLLIEQPAPSSLPNNLATLLASGNSQPMETQMEKIRSHNFLSEVVQKAHLNVDPGALIGRIKLIPGPGGQIMDIVVRGDSPKEAANIANLVSRIYRENTMQEADAKANLSTIHLKQAQDLAEKNKNLATERYNAFLRRLGVSDPNTFYATRTNAAVGVHSGLDTARADLKVQESRRALLAQQLKTTAPEIVAGYSQEKNPVIPEYRKSLYDLQLRRGKLLYDFNESSPEVKEVDNEIATVQKQIANALKNVYDVGSKSVSRNPEYTSARQNLVSADLAIETAKASIAANEKLSTDLQAEQKRLAADRTEYEDLLRTKNAAVSDYDRLRTGITEVDLQHIAAVPNVRILEAAMPANTPISPKPLLNLVGSIGLGLFLGILFSLLAEYFTHPEIDPTIAPYLPSVAGVPLLGAVSIALPQRLSSEGILTTALPPASARSEDAFREIGYVLAHRTAKQPAPIILLSGTRSDNTTAAVAAQISATLVRDGLRVTLVDADRAHPRLNRVFGAPDAPGLAEALSGSVKVLDILHIGASGALRFLSAGSPTEHASYDEKRLRSILGDLAKDSDLVIVSGPSVWTAQAISPLERAADGMALVTSADTPPEESVARARRLLTNGYQPRLVGVILSETAGDDSPLPVPFEPAALTVGTKSDSLENDT